MLYLKQSTAGQAVLIGPFVDATDGTTAETALSIANTDIRLSANGGNLAAKTSGGATHDEAGWYTTTLDATDTATVGRLQLHCKMAGALMVHAEFQVLEEAVFDALIGASALGYVANAPVNVAQLSGDATAADNAEAFFDGTGYAGTNNVIPTVTTLTGHTAQTGDTYALANGAAGFVAIDTVVDQILADTGTDGVVVAGASKTGYTLTATTGLGNQTADITGSLSGSVGSVTGAVGSVTGAVGSVTGAVGSVTGAVGSVTGNVGGNVVGSVASVTGAVGSVTGAVGGNVTGSVGSLAAQAKTDVNAEVVDALNTDTYAEPGQGAPAATATLAAKLGYLFKWARNKKDNDGSTTQFYADDGTTVDHKQTTGEAAGTVTKGEITSGP